MSRYIKELIKQGEHQELDFKFEISNSKKIARTLSAFSNTDGGKLLVGVKDNGKISGVRSEEEVYMVKGAAELFCKPPIPLKIDSWEISGKTVLEVTVQKAKERPVYAKDDSGQWKAWIRKEDENFIANRILIKSWARKNRKRGTFLEMTEKEKSFLKHLDEHQIINFSKLRRITKSTSPQTEILLINFLSLDIIELEYLPKGIYYRYKQRDNPLKNRL